MDDMNIKADEVQPESNPTSEAVQEKAAGAPKAEKTARKPHTRGRKAAKPKASADGQKRAKGSIQYPWYDLENAVVVARAILDGGGLPVTREQLAGALRITPTGGNFILRTSAARMFGLIELVQSKFQLTPLGFTILGRDEAKERAAKADAFLHVELYRRVYEEFRGKSLPPRPHGLENAFVQFGVSPKSRKVARQVFERSARQAGYSNVDPDRLIEPIMGAGGATERQSAEASADFPQPTMYGGGGPEMSSFLELDELVRGLLRRLPNPGEGWTADLKAKWLRALSQNLDFVYKLEGNKIVAIEVKDETP